MPPPFRFHSENVLVDRLCNADREVVFFFGSPLTMAESPGAPGVPGVAGVISLVEEELEGSPGAVNEIREVVKTGDHANAYRTAFGLLQGYRGQDTANRVIRRAVLEAREVRADPRELLDAALSIKGFKEACRAIQSDSRNWHLNASLADLGRLLARYRPKFGTVVLTTNFDPLIEVSIIRAGGRCFRTVVYADGSLGAAQGEGSHVVYLHGYWFGADTLHTPQQLEQARPNLRRSLERLLAHRTLVVLGCGGWDDVFTESLADLLSDHEASPDVLWTFYGSDETDLVRKSGYLLKLLQPGIDRGRVVLFSGVDLCRLIQSLHARLKSTGTDGQDPDDVRFLLDRIYELAPDLRNEISNSLNPDLVNQVDELSTRREALEQELEEERRSSGARVDELQGQRDQLAE